MALVAILGVIPSSLDSVRKAGETTNNVRLVSQLISEIQSADWGECDTQTKTWSKLKNMFDQRWYYDDQGNLLELDSSNFENRLAYVVRVVETEPKYRLPGQTEDSIFTYALNVDIASTGQSNFGFANPNLYNSYPIIVSKQVSTEEMK